MGQTTGLRLLMDESTIRLLFMIATPLVAVAGAGAVARFQISSLTKRLEQLAQNQKTIFDKLDKTAQDMVVFKSHVETIRELLKVDKLQQHWVEDAQFKTATNHVVDNLRRDVDRVDTELAGIKRVILQDFYEVKKGKTGK